MRRRTSEHAVVIGGSVAGLPAARALADSHDRVTVIDRDTFPKGSEGRRSVPQGRHCHALSARPRSVREPAAGHHGRDDRRRGADLRALRRRPVRGRRPPARACHAGDHDGDRQPALHRRARAAADSRAGQRRTAGRMRSSRSGRHPRRPPRNRCQGSLLRRRNRRTRRSDACRNRALGADPGLAEASATNGLPSPGST